MSKTTIVQDVLDVFRAAGFEVRVSEFGDKPETIIYGTSDNAGILMESVCEHFGISAEAAFSCAQRENKEGDAPLTAPAPQQSESIDIERFEAVCPEVYTDAERELLWKGWQLAKAAPAAPVQTAEPKRIPDMLTVETIQGAIAFGRMGINPPPSPDHWGNEFWQIGRQLAKLSETSAWDNVTPVDVAAPVQAEQAQAELPAILFDGKAVYDEVLRWPTSTNAQDVAEVLDAVVRLMRKEGALPAQAEQAAAVRAAELTSDDVQWVTNDIAELGVKIGNQFFFLYKGGSLIYEDAVHDDGTPMHWRPVFKREFGECAHPINYKNPQLIGTVSLSDSDEWQILPAAPSTATSKEGGDRE